MKYILKGILISTCIVALLWAFGRAFDSYFDQKGEMLCNSAKKSGNEVYLVKCQCYYKGEGIRCIYLKGEK